MGLSLASYGAYTNASLCTVMIVLLIELMDDGDWILVFKRGLEYIITFLMGMTFYYIVLRCFLHFQELEVFEYMNEEKLLEGLPGISAIISWIKAGWCDVVIYMQSGAMNKVMLFLGVILLFLQMYHIGKKNLKAINIVLELLILGLFPLGAGLIHVMAFGAVNARMRFAYVMPFVLLIVLVDREWGRVGDICLKDLIKIEGEGQNFLTVIVEQAIISLTVCLLSILICIMVCRGVLEANIAYMQINKMDNVNKSLMTRIISRVEECEGFGGNEVLVIAGNLKENDYIFYRGRAVERSQWELWGWNIEFNGAQSGLTYNGVLANLLWTDAGLPLNIVPYSHEYYTDEEQISIEQMPDFPADGSVKKIRDTVVIKFSDELEEWE